MAQSNYAACVDFVRKQEGGNCDTPGDRGGRTGRGGITHTTYDAWRVDHGFPTQDVWLISDKEIASIYYGEYWKPVNGDALPVGVDLCVFDESINSGPARALKTLAQAGGIEADSNDLIHKICSARLSFMRSLGSWGQFGGAWGRRVGQCEALAHQMANGTAAQPAIQAAAKVAAQKVSEHSAVAGAVVLGGTVVASSYRDIIDFNHPWLLAAGAVAALIVVANIMLARAQSARSTALTKAAAPTIEAPSVPVAPTAPADPLDALTATVERLQGLQADAEAARVAALAQIDAQQKSIEDQMAKLEAAKKAIENFNAPATAPAVAPIQPPPATPSPPANPTPPTPEAPVAPAAPQ